MSENTSSRIDRMGMEMGSDVSDPIHAAVMRERERCAKICEELAADAADKQCDGIMYATADGWIESAAAKIRSGK